MSGIGWNSDLVEREIGAEAERRRILGLIDDLQRNIQAQAKAQIAAGLPAERALSAQNEVLTLLSVAIGR